MRMLETHNQIRQKDLEEIANSDIVDNFRNKTVLVTGATGLLGSEIVFALLCSNRLKSLNTKIIALVRNKEKAEKLFKAFLKSNNFKLIVQDIREPLFYEGNVDYIIHAASETASLSFIETPVETILTSVEGTKNILEFSKEKNVESVAYLSSIEIYGTYPRETLVNEDEYGFINPLLPRSSYSESKRLCENLCISYYNEYKVPVKIARLTQTFGAGVEYSDNRIFAQFAKSVLTKTDIVLNTTGGSKKSYCDVKDSVIALFTILIKGKPGEAYNIANPDTYISIRKMAELVAKKYSIGVKYDTNKKSDCYPLDSKVNLDITKIKSLGWKPSIGLEDIYDKLINSFEEEV